MCESAEFSPLVGLLKMRFPEKWEFWERVPFVYKICKRIYQKPEKFLNCLRFFFFFPLSDSKLNCFTNISMLFLLTYILTSV